MMMRCRSQYELRNPDPGTEFIILFIFFLSEFIPNSDRLQEKMAHLGSTPHHPK
jgi:hypothetical protein